MKKQQTQRKYTAKINKISFLHLLFRHYTIDILIGSYLAYRLWRYYHSMNPFFVWLESNPAIVALKAEESEERDDTLLRWIQRAPPFSDISKEYVLFCFRLRFEISFFFLLCFWFQIYWFPFFSSIPVVLDMRKKDKREPRLLKREKSTTNNNRRFIQCLVFISFVYCCITLFFVPA